MRNKSSAYRSSKAVKQGSHRTYNLHHTTRCHACQKAREPSKMELITSTLASATYVLVSILLTVAFLITQNYAMLPIVTVIVHELGDVLLQMVGMFSSKKSRRKRAR